MTEQTTIYIKKNENYTYRTPFQTINIVQMVDESVDPLTLELSPSTVPIPTSTPAKLQTIADQTEVLTITPLQESFSGNVETYYFECTGVEPSETTRTPYTGSLRCEPTKLHVIFYKITGDPTVYYTVFIPSVALEIPTMGPAGGEYYIYIGNNSSGNAPFLADKNNANSAERKVTIEVDTTELHWITNFDNLKIYKWKNPTLNILPNN